MNIIDEIAQSHMKPAGTVPAFNVGDTVRVHFRIVEGDKKRIQIFEGVVIARKGGVGPMARFTVRRIAYGEGVERVFPLHSPLVEDVEVIREGQPRRAKLYYLRERVGKSARVKAKTRVSSTKDQARAAMEAARAPEAVTEEASDTPDDTEPSETPQTPEEQPKATKDEANEKKSE